MSTTKHTLIYEKGALQKMATLYQFSSIFTVVINASYNIKQYKNTEKKKQKQNKFFLFFWFNYEILGLCCAVLCCTILCSVCLLLLLLLLIQLHTTVTFVIFFFFFFVWEMHGCMRTVCQQSIIFSTFFILQRHFLVVVDYCTWKIVHAR